MHAAHTCCRPADACTPVFGRVNHRLQHGLVGGAPSEHVLRGDLCVAD